MTAGSSERTSECDQQQSSRAAAAGSEDGRRGRLNRSCSSQTDSLSSICMWDDSIRYTSNDASEMKAEESDAKKEQKQSGESRASQSQLASAGSGGSNTQSDGRKAAASSSPVNDHAQPLKQSDVDSDAGEADCSPRTDRLAKCETTKAAETSSAAVAAAATPPDLRQHSAECGTSNAPQSKSKQMAKRTKSAVAASSQPKKGAAKKADAAAVGTKPARAAKKPASESCGDAMTAVIDKRQHHGKWRWKVQWKSGAMVSLDNKRAGSPMHRSPGHGPWLDLKFSC